MNSADQQQKERQREEFWDFSRLQPLYGKDEELQILRSTHSRFSAGARDYNEVVWVTGHSGTGKSALIREAFQHNNNNKRDKKFFARGKFDRLQTAHQPYSALVDACSKLCNDLIQQERNDTKGGGRIYSLMRTEDVSILASLIPNFRKLMITNKVDVVTEEGYHGYKMQHGFKRVRKALASFFEALCSVHEEREAVVLFLDDLQWADGQTMEVLQSVLTGGAVRGVMFIGATRDDEVSDSLRQTMEAVEQAECARSTTIELSNLKSNDVDQIFTDLIQPASCDSLTVVAETVFHRTQGNPFFTLHFIRELYNQGLLKFSSSSSPSSSPCVSCDCDVKSILQSSRDVPLEEIVLTTLHDLPKTTGDILVVASCLGTEFPLDILSSIVREYFRQAQKLDLSHYTFVTEHLKGASKRGLVDYDEERNVFMFHHDKIQEIVCNQVTEAKREKLHYQIGVLLRAFTERRAQMEKSQDLYPLLSTVVVQMNRGSHFISNEDERVSLAELNARVATVMINKSCFFAAKSFLQEGYSLLSKSKWSDRCYELTLDITSTLTEIYFSTANIVTCLQMIDEIYTNAQRTDDKHRAQVVHTEALASANRLTESIDKSISILTELGEKIPRHPTSAQTVASITKVKKALRGHSDESLLNLPNMEDERKLVAMGILSQLVPTAYFAQQQALIPVATALMMELSIRHGVSEHTPIAFATFGFGLSASLDFEAAYRFGSLALKLMDRYGNDPGTLVIAYGLLMHLKSPIRTCLPMLLKGYRLAVEQGNSSYEGHGSALYTTASFYGGSPLDHVASELENFLEMMSRSGNYQKSGKALSMSGRVISKLIGNTSKWPNLESCHMEREELFLEGLQKSNSALLLLMFQYQTMMTSYYMDFMELAIVRGEKAWASKDITGSGTYWCAYCMFSALTALEACRMYPKKVKKYQKVFRRYQQVLLKWKKQGYPNCLHKIELLTAQEMVCIGTARTHEVIQVFDNSISIASKNGFIQDAALGKELAGAFLKRRKYMERAIQYIEAARELYTAWGALAKVKQLEQKYFAILSQRPTPWTARNHSWIREGSSSSFRFSD